MYQQIAQHFNRIQATVTDACALAMEVPCFSRGIWLAGASDCCSLRYSLACAQLDGRSHLRQRRHRLAIGALPGGRQVMLPVMAGHGEWRQTPAAASQLTPPCELDHTGRHRLSFGRERASPCLCEAVYHVLKYMLSHPAVTIRTAHAMNQAAAK